MATSTFRTADRFLAACEAAESRAAGDPGKLATELRTMLLQEMTEADAWKERSEQLQAATTLPPGHPDRAASFFASRPMPEPTDAAMQAVYQAAAPGALDWPWPEGLRAVIREFSAAPVAPAAPVAQPAGRLHADGYFTWSKGVTPGYERDKLLPCHFYLAPALPAAPVAHALEPLTKEQRFRAFCAADKRMMLIGSSSWRDVIADEIERAHGITPALPSAPVAPAAPLASGPGEDAMHCRDCADFGPTCPSTGLPCASQEGGAL